MVKFTKEFIIAEMQKSYEKNGFAPRCVNNDLPFSKSVVRNRGMSWTAALEAAGIPLTVHPARLVNCIVCGLEFDKPVCQMRKSVNNFCSHKCACTHRNTGRVVSNETRKKISEALRAKYTLYNPCIVCKNIHSHRRRKTCSNKCRALSRTKAYTNNQRD